MIEEILELYAYNRWANHRVLEATGKLGAEQFSRDLHSSFPSVRDTLVHMLGAEWVWLERWKGTSPTGLPGRSDLSTHEAIRARWREVEHGQLEFLEQVSDEQLLQDLAYRNTAGKPFVQPLWQVLRHVVNHASYHRGQVTTMLRQLAAEPVTTDLVVFYREGAGSAARAAGA